MAVAAMSAGDEVVVVQVGTHANGDRLLAGVEMHESGDQSGGKIGV